MRSLIFFFLTPLVLVACGDSNDTNVTAVQDLPAIQGSSAVGFTSFSANDAARADRELRVDVWYPVDDVDVIEGPGAFYSVSGSIIGITSDLATIDLPVSQQENRNLIVFSHGYNDFSHTSYPLMETLASQGFIVVAPEHTGNTANSPSNTPEEDAVAISNRVPDISFVIDEMLRRDARLGDSFEGRISAANIGVVGHSWGGATTLGVAVGFGDASADARVSAIMPVAVEFREFFPFTDQDIKRLSIPTLLLGGTMDTIVDIENNRTIFSSSNNSPTYSIEIVGAGHAHFTGFCDVTAALLDFGFNVDELDSLGVGDGYRKTCLPDVFEIDESIRIQNLYGVAFFKAYLQNDDRFEDYLTDLYAGKNEPAVLFSEK